MTIFKGDTVNCFLDGFVSIISKFSTQSHSFIDVFEGGIFINMGDEHSFKTGNNFIRHLLFFVEYGKHHADIIEL